MLTSGGFAAARFYAERRSCLDCAGLAAYFARTRKNPVTRWCSSTQNPRTGQPRHRRTSFINEFFIVLDMFGNF